MKHVKRSVILLATLLLYTMSVAFAFQYFFRTEPKLVNSGLTIAPDPDYYAQTRFSLSQETSTNLTEPQTLQISQGQMENIAITGDLNCLMNFTNYESLIIQTGAFTGQGFAKGNWTATIGNLRTQGTWATYVLVNVAERRIYHKGAVSGEMTGTSEGYVFESVNGSGVYDFYYSTWKLNRIGSDPVSAAIELNGTISYNGSTISPSVLQSIHQTTLKGSAWGHYTGPLSLVVTWVRIEDMNSTYKGEGFSRVSYLSGTGSGEGWMYQKAIPAGNTESNGMSSEPVAGLISSEFDEHNSPVIMTGAIHRLDVGLPVKSDLHVKILGLENVSPGQRLTYVVEYRNDGLKDANEVIALSDISHWFKYISGSGNASYDPFAQQVSWNLGEVAAKEIGYLSFQVEVASGLPANLPLKSASACLVQASPEQPISDLTTYSTGLCTDTRANSWPGELRNLENDFGAKVVPLYDQTNPITGALHAYAAMKNIPTPENGLLNPDLAGYQENYICYSASTASYETLTLNKRIWGENLYVISPMGYSNEKLAEMRRLSNEGKGFKKIVVYTGDDDVLPWGWGDTIHVNFQQSEILTQYGDGPWLSLERALFGWHSIPAYLLDRILADLKESIRNTIGKEPRSITIDSKVPGNQFVIEWEDSSTEIFNLQRDRNTGNDFQDGDGVIVVRIDGADHEEIEKVVQRFRADYERMPLKEDSPKLRQILKELRERGSSLRSFIRVARDPNIKYGSCRYVLAGQTLNYTVGYENEGEGIAFGVYIADTLNKNLNASTLGIKQNGTYDHSTRTVTWLIGEVGPHGKGSVTYSVNLNSNASIGTEIINFATVFFPSVPETTMTNGVVNIISYAHDVAVLDAESSRAFVGKSYSLSINVTLENRGVNNETFSVRVFANSTSFGSKETTLQSGQYGVSTFEWNTTGFAYGNYSISACVEPIPGEGDITDNNLTRGWILVSIPGDINADRKVDLKDVFAVGKAFGTTREGPNPSGRTYVLNCDINDDGKIDLKDYFATCKNYGKSW